MSIGHVSPEAASGGEIALLRNGDEIEIDITERKMNVLLSDSELAERAKAENTKGDKAFKPSSRNRQISQALKLYSYFVSSADTGGVRKHLD